MALLMAWLSLLFTGLAPCGFSIPLPSIGCNRREFGSAIESIGTPTKESIRVMDFEILDRFYYLVRGPRPNEPAPLLFAIHGQGGDAMTFISYHNFSSLGKTANLMVVYPQGMHDFFPGEDQGTGWNVGSAGDNSTCVLEGVGQAYGCYESCRKLNRCGRCDWSTCYNDVLFVSEVLKQVSRNSCVDLHRVYVQGESNGAMMVHHLVRELPSTFAAVATWFGTPMVGYLLGGLLQLADNHHLPNETSILALHARSDITIPSSGGASADGWLYESFLQSTGVWAALHKCDRQGSPIKTKWDAGPLNFHCSEYLHCATGRRVLQCMYDGVHGDYPAGSDGDEITLWFLLQFSRGALGHSDEKPPQIFGQCSTTRSGSFSWPVNWLAILGSLSAGCMLGCAARPKFARLFFGPKYQQFPNQDGISTNTVGVIEE